MNFCDEPPIQELSNKLIKLKSVLRRNYGLLCEKFPEILFYLINFNAKDSFFSRLGSGGKFSTMQTDDLTGKT